MQGDDGSRDAPTFADTLQKWLDGGVLQDVVEELRSKLVG